jgi:ABC-type dipeptide/oligopeptide/nickel transport system permease component
VARRLIEQIGLGLLAFLGVITITFLLQYVVPGDPARALVPRAVSPQQLAEIRAQLHLNEPLVTQYVSYLGGLARGDLGQSYVQDASVSSLIFARLPATIMLAVAGVVVEVVIGTVLGVWAVLKPGSGRFVTTANLLLLSVPVFTLGLVMLLFFGYTLGWAPVSGGTSPSKLVLPALALGLIGAPYYSQIVREQLQTSLSSSYVRTAITKGVSDRRVLARHVVRNVSSPLITMIGLDLGLYLSGVIVIEAVFGWPGMGQLAVLSLARLDRPVVMGTVIVAAAAVIAFNIVADAIRMLVDPRTRVQP